MALKKAILYICAVIFLILLSQDCHASILGGEVELGWPKGEYYVHFGSDPVNLKNGNIYYPVNDLSIPSVGFPLTVSRSYNSRSRYSGIFGFGWSSSLDVRAEVYENTVVIIESDGFRDTFNFAGEEGENRRFQSASGRTIEVSKSNSIMFDPRTGEKRTFDSDGKILEQTDRYGNKQTFTYNAKGHLTQVQGTAGRLLNIQTDASGKVVQIIDPIERKIRYKYDSRNNLIEVIDKGGHKTAFTYDDLHNLTAIEYPNGGKTLLAYDVTRDLIVEESGPEDRHTRYRYQIQPGNSDAWSVEVIDALENVTRYDYSKNGSHLIITDALGGKVIKEACPDCGGSLSAYTDARGNTTRYEYTSEKGHQITTVTDPLGHKTKRFYDTTTGSLLKEVAPNGATTVYSYDKAGNLIETKDALGNSSKYGYDQRGQLVQVNDKRGGITRFNYDRYGNLIAQVDPVGYKTQFEYDLIGRLVKIIDAKGGITEFEFTADDYLASTKDPLGYVVRNEYNEIGLLVKASDSISVLTTLSYNQAGDLLETSDGMNQTARFIYDPLGNLTSFTNARGFIWKFYYDALGRKVESTDPLGNKEIMEYDPAGNIIRLREPLGDITLYEHDALNRLRKITNPLGLCMSYAYDRAGNIAKVEDSMGNISYYAYDLMGRLTIEVDSIGRDKRYNYDAAGNLIATWMPYHPPTEYEYDLNNRLTKATYPGQGTLRIKYDPAGNPIESIDLSGRTRRFTFDARHQLSQLSDYDGQVRNYKRDMRGNIVELAVQGKATFHYSYDVLNRILEIKGPGGRTRIYTYDAESNQLTSSDGKEHTRAFSYDALNRLTDVRYPDGTKAFFSYDAAGNLIRWRNGHSDISAVYGPMGTMRSMRYIKPKVHLDMNYDKRGNLSVINLPDGRQIQYEYDSLKRLQQISLVSGPWVKLAYDEFGRVIRRDYSNMLSQFNEYTESGRTSAIRIGAGQKEHLMEKQYQYDKKGNLTTEIGENHRFTYSYKNDQLVTADLGQWGTLRLDYNDHGNRNREEWAGKSEEYKYNSLGQVISAGSETFQWDERGNLVERENGSHRFLFEYNGDGQLVRLKTGAGDQTSYAYDALGMLISRKRKHVSQYLVNIEGALLLVLDEEGKVKETWAYENIDRPLFSVGDGRSQFYHQDILNNIFLVTGVHGAAVDERMYNPFGVILSGHVGLWDPAYAARPWDPLTRLYDMRFRHYDPKMGLFITPDPLLFESNYYVYARNNPLEFEDPFGLSPKKRGPCDDKLARFKQLEALFKKEVQPLLEIQKIPGKISEIDKKIDRLQRQKMWGVWMGQFTIKFTQYVHAIGSAVYGGLGAPETLGKGQGALIGVITAVFGVEFMSPSEQLYKLRLAETIINNKLNSLNAARWQLIRKRRRFYSRQWGKLYPKLDKLRFKMIGAWNDYLDCKNCQR